MVRDGGSKVFRVGAGVEATPVSTVGGSPTIHAPVPGGVNADGRLDGGKLMPVSKSVIAAALPGGAAQGP
jgi:hypothetical protein